LEFGPATTMTFEANLCLYCAKDPFT